jgi:hypothetical protein
MPSATAEDAPNAKSSSVVTMILRIVFFMFLSCGEVGFDFLGKSIAAGLLPTGLNSLFFDSSNVAEVLVTDQVTDMTVC